MNLRTYKSVNTHNLPPELIDLVFVQQVHLLQSARRFGDTGSASQEDVARHEAGHVVVANMLGGSVRRCWVQQQQGSWGGYTSLQEPHDWRILLRNAEKCAYTPRGCVGHTLFTLAGPVAERMEGGGGGIANLATDLPELMDSIEALRIAVLMAMFPDDPPSADEDAQFHQDSVTAIISRLVSQLHSLLQAEAPRIRAVAAKLRTHGRLVAHEIEPLMRGIPSLCVSSVFDELRQGLPVGPLPGALPSAYFQALPRLRE